MRLRTLVAASVCLALAAIGARAASKLELPPGPGRDLVYAQCQTCHDPQYLNDSAGITRDDWDAAIDNMKQYGLRIPPDQRAKILDYLATYLGPNPPPKTETPAPERGASVDGVTAFNENCGACHQPNGQGVPGQFPPLAGNRDVFLKGDYAIKVVLYGMEGELSVGDKTFRSVMPPFGHLDDGQIAAIVNYTREAWGNAKLAPADLAKVDAAAVQAARGKPMTPAAMLSYRNDLKTSQR